MIFQNRMDNHTLSGIAVPLVTKEKEAHFILSG